MILVRKLSQVRVKSHSSIWAKLHVCNMSTNGKEPQLVAEKVGGLLQISLNRPTALNSLTLDMCERMNKLLLGDINGPDSDVGAFLVKSTPNSKAFCAGGDVKSIWDEIVNRTDIPLEYIGSGMPGYLHTDFFRTEYIMNDMLEKSNAPQISVWDGYVMGGGVGLSIFGEFRIATDKTVFAMPETAIGLFPDVGGSAWLPHLDGDGVGSYIGMTGCRLSAADLLHVGIATHYLPDAGAVAAVEEQLQRSTSLVGADALQSRKIVKEILDGAQMQYVKPDASQSHLATHAEVISECFGEHVTDVETIAVRLGQLSGSDEWASKTLKTLMKMSPTSLKLTLEQLKRGKHLDLKGCLRMEYRMMMNCMRPAAGASGAGASSTGSSSSIGTGDFREGIRALLVDKDNAPQWQPPSLDQVSREMIDAYFQPLGEHDLVCHTAAAGATTDSPTHTR